MLISLMGPCLKAGCTGSIEFAVDDQLGDESTEASLVATAEKVATERGGWLCPRCGDWTAFERPLRDAITAAIAIKSAADKTATALR